MMVLNDRIPLTGNQTILIEGVFMLYCENCRKENKYPMSVIGSYGQCQMCGGVDFCNDVPHRHLPTKTPIEELKAYPGIGIRIERLPV